MTAKMAHAKDSAVSPVVWGVKIMCVECWRVKAQTETDLALTAGHPFGQLVAPLLAWYQPPGQLGQVVPDFT